MYTAVILNHGDTNRFKIYDFLTTVNRAGLTSMPNNAMAWGPPVQGGPPWAARIFLIFKFH